MIKRNRLDINDALIVYPIALAVYFVATLLATLTWVLPSSGMGATWNALNIPTWIIVFFSIFALFVTTFLYGKVAKIDYGEALGMKKKPEAKTIGIGLLFVAGLILFLLPATNFFVGALEKLRISLGKEAFPDIVTASNYPVWDLIMQIILVCFLPGFCEEVLMRGFIAQGLGEKFNKITASLLSGAIFMLFHMNPQQTIYQFVLGFALGYVMLTVRCIWVPVIMHTFNNLLTVVLDATMSVKAQIAFFETLWYVPTVIGAVIVAVAVFLFVKFVVKAKNGAVQTDSEGEVESIGEPVCNQDEQPQACAQEATINGEVIAQEQVTQSQPCAETTMRERRKDVSAAGLVLSLVAVTICCAVWIITLFS